MKYQYSDIEIVEKLVYQYFDAVYSADVDMVRALFHRNAAMYGDLGGAILAGTPEPFFQDLRSKPSMQTRNIDCKAMITYLVVTGHIASVTLLVDNFYGEVNVEDHFHLLKEGEDWKIVCKTFTTLT